MATSKKDALETFQEYGIYIPTRTISLDTAYDADGNDIGVSHAMATKFIKNFHVLNHISADPIEIILNTPGGTSVDGMAIYDLIKTSRCYVTIKVYGQACSMGHTILQAANHRLISKNSIVMLHAGVSGVPEVNPWEARRSAEFDEAWSHKMFMITLDRINQKRDKDGQAHMSKKHFIDEYILRAKFLTAEEAVSLGLADEIIEEIGEA